MSISDELTTRHWRSKNSLDRDDLIKIPIFLPEFSRQERLSYKITLSKMTPSPETSHDPSDRPATIDWNAALLENGRWMRTVVRCRVSDSHVVDDLMQEIALAIFKQNSRPTAAEKVAPWLYQLAVRHTANYQRHNGRQKKLIDSFAEELSSKTESAESNPLDWLLANEQRDVVAGAIESLAADDREILMLKYTEGWCYQELSEHLGVNLNTLEYRLVRAKKRLRQLLCKNRQKES